MNKRLFTIMTVLLIAVLATSPVAAKGLIQLKDPSFGLGSLTLNGTLTGIGGYTEGIFLTLRATGQPVVTCSNPAGNQSPGQNPSKVTVTGEEFIPGLAIDAKGRYAVDVETVEPTTLPAAEGGCPNNKWTATIDNILWENVYINVYAGNSAIDGNKLLYQRYTCNPALQTATSLSCTLAESISYH